MDRRQPVAELVGDAGGELAEPREAVLQPQLLFEIDDFAQIGEQADRAVRRDPLSSRIGETVMPRCDAPAPGCAICTARRTIGRARDEAFVDDVGERRRVGEHLAVIALRSAVLGKAEQPLARRD